MLDVGAPHLAPQLLPPGDGLLLCTAIVGPPRCARQVEGRELRAEAGGGTTPGAPHASAAACAAAGRGRTPSSSSARTACSDSSCRGGCSEGPQPQLQRPGTPLRYPLRRLMQCQRHPSASPREQPQQRLFVRVRVALRRTSRPEGCEGRSEGGGGAGPGTQHPPPHRCPKAQPQAPLLLRRHQGPRGSLAHVAPGGTGAASSPGPLLPAPHCQSQLKGPQGSRGGPLRGPQLGRPPQSQGAAHPSQEEAGGARGGDGRCRCTEAPPPACECSRPAPPHPQRAARPRSDPGSVRVEEGGTRGTAGGRGWGGEVPAFSPPHRRTHRRSRIHSSHAASTLPSPSSNAPPLEDPLEPRRQRALREGCAKVALGERSLP